ncbi:hypothetical protein ACHAXA_000905 [Cyclostephanos tholiformis]|uniref:Uncharacterized protein n=1 Tax=Cyclostephanos tholiformis TaxID=382380 RepID=A0ABD3RX87_9STRA
MFAAPQHHEVAGGGGGANVDGDRRGFRAMFAASQRGRGGDGGSSSRFGSWRKLLFNLRDSLRNLDSSHRLNVTCSGSDLGQLYLSSPELDVVRIPRGLGEDGHVPRRGSSWLLDAVDPYGRRKSFRRLSTYERFLDSDALDEIHDSDEGRIMLIEDETDECADNRLTSFSRRLSSKRSFNSPSVVVPIMYIYYVINRQSQTLPLCK